MAEEERDAVGADGAAGESGSGGRATSAAGSGPSPWPSDRKADERDTDDRAESTPSKPTPTSEVRKKAAWGAPLDRLDKAWTKLDARLCAAVLLAEVATLVFWISLKALSNTGHGGPGMVFRCMVTALVFGVATNLIARKRTERHEALATAAVVIGLVVGAFWGDAGTAYFANLQAWIQNASIFVFFGGTSEVAKRLTLWLALLGASVATGQGKHINVDVVMRFLSPRARVPVAILGWIAAAVVCFAAVWGFFDHVAVEDYRLPTTVACADNPSKQCPIPRGEEISKVLHESRRDMFLAGRQLSLDLRSLPRMLTGTPYNQWLTAKEWNQWLRDGGWESHFAAEDVKAMELPEDGSGPEFRTPAVTSVPGGSEQVRMLLVRELNFVVAFGLLVIGLRFVIRSLLAIAGWVTVDPNAAHGDDDLAHAHDAAAHASSVETAIKETT